MSSAPPGRYQSRFFNFLSSQSLRVKEGLAQTLRHLKVKVNWGLEALLYQLRAIAAIVKRAGKRLGQGFSPKHTLDGNTEAGAKPEGVAPELGATSDTEAKQLPQGTIDPDLMIHLSESPITDSPLSLLFASLDAKVAQLEAGGWQQVPQALGGALTKVRQKVGLPAVPQEEITTQGQQFPEKIAALLRAAVAYFFGGASEQPVMPPEQGQEQLNGAETGGLPSSPSHRLPVSSLGAKFRQSVLKVRQKLGLPAVPQEEITTEGQQLPEKIAALLLAAVAYFFGGSSEPPGMPPEQGQEQLNGAETGGLPPSPSPRLPVSPLGAKFRLSVLKVRHQIERWGTALVSDREFTPEPMPDRMENLIRAAVDYFLGLGKTSLPGEESNEAWRGDGETGRLGDGETRRQGAKAQLQTSSGAKAQLQTGELAGELTADLWREPQAGAVLNGSESLGIAKAREMARSLRRQVQEVVKAAPLVPKSQVTTGKPQVVNETQAVATGGAATLELERATAAQTEWQPDFLETRAEVTGYVKHPLELVLEWLDRALVWVETAIGKLWRLGMQWWQRLRERAQ